MDLVLASNKLKASHLQFGVYKRLFLSIWKITRRGIATTMKLYQVKITIKILSMNGLEDS